jgi:hypothetical protein
MDKVLLPRTIIEIVVFSMKKLIKHSHYNNAKNAGNI